MSGGRSGCKDTRGAPLRSKIGNSFSSLFFLLTNGIRCPDTQTGLRAIPPGLHALALSEDGDRYDFEMNFLSDAVRTAELRFVPITTVYTDRNSGSHFRTVSDALRVHGRFFRYVCASLAGALTDLLLFAVLSAVLPLEETAAIFAATVIARICSGIVNFLLNRFWSFRSRAKAAGEAVRYGILFVCQMCASGGLVALLNVLPIPSVVSKIIVDTLLFFISFIIQKNWVFRK